MEERVKHLPDLEKNMEKALSAHDCNCGNVQLFLRAFKQEQELEVWVKNMQARSWKLLTCFPFSAMSGRLGPKQKEGDRQIPEGIYHIDRFNPKSRYHLSLGLNYPNEADRLRGDPEEPGSDIFIHGGCETVGCIPITDEGIEAVYLLAEWARTAGQEKMPVHIFPFRFNGELWEKYGPAYAQWQSLWKDLEMVYLAFERSKKLPPVGILASGQYFIDHR